VKDKKIKKGFYTNGTQARSWKLGVRKSKKRENGKLKGVKTT
jgi:hypothetical protein